MATPPRTKQPAGRGRPKTRVGVILSKILGGITTLVLLSIIGGIAYTVYLVRETAAALPATDSLMDYLPGGATEILATDKDPATGDNVVLGRVFTQFKEFAPITDIPPALQDATIAIEDERFYDHSGIDLRGTIRAVFKDVEGRHMSEGGSTLTQQLARNIFLTQKKTFNRKLREAILALELEKNFTKEQILEMYLNEVCYGNNTYGVKAAAKTYFGKDLNKLTVAECALLAGLPQSPTEHDPFRHINSALRRRNEVLQHMLDQHKLTADQEQAALDEDPHLVPPHLHHETEFKAPYFTSYVLHQLTQKYGVDEVYKGGLRVYTTLNYQMQQQAESALANGILSGADNHVSDGALVTLEPHTGYIRAMVGGLDFKKRQYNNATQGHRQPGSSFKAFVYSTAFMLNPKRFSPETEIDDSPVTFGKGAGAYRPKNFEGRFEGYMTIKHAFAHSVNVPAVKVANMIGIQNVIHTAHAMGITSRLRPDLSLALGSNAVAPIEMASAYSVFANSGSHAEPMAIIRVVDGDGKELENDEPQVEPNVLPAYVVSEMTSMMREVVEHGTAAGAKEIHQVENACGKTGTTNDNRDAWFIGYTPELTTAVWVAGAKYEYKNGKEIPRYVQMSGITGGMICAPIWAHFMLAAVPIQRQAGLNPTPAPSADSGASHHFVPMAARPAAPVVPEDADMTPDAGPTPTPDPAGADPGSTPATAPTPADGAPPANPTAVPPNANAANGGGTPAPFIPKATPPTPIPDPASTLADGEPILPPAPRMTTRATPAARNLPRMVTVSVCEDSGMLATQWCPVTVKRTLPANRAPRQYCTRHRPQPGDQ